MTNNISSAETILVTGGAGYIGSHVCKWLSRNGYTPVVYDNFCSGNRFQVKWGPLEEGDVRDAARLSDVITRYNPSAIMHFAALIQVGESVDNPSLYYNNNVGSSLTLLEAARKHDVRNIVFSSTAAVYGIPQQVPIPEEAMKQPINPYGNTKLIIEKAIADYAAAYGMRYAILRYFNAAGADADGDSGPAYKTDTHIIPLLMRVACGMNPSIKIFGTDYATADGTAIRDYIHVTDLATAHILALQHLLQGKENLTLNIGTNRGLSVREVVDMARQVTGQPIPEERVARRAGDPPSLVADASRARKVLGWSPEHSDLQTILRTAWAWRQKLGEIQAKR